MLWVQNAELLNAKAGVESSNHYVLNELSTIFSAFVSYLLHTPML